MSSSKVLPFVADSDEEGSAGRRPSVLRDKPVQFSRGLPLLDAQALKMADRYKRESYMMFPMINGLGLGMAFAVYELGNTQQYDRQIRVLRDNECGWLFICVWLFCNLTLWLNVYPMFYKNKIMHSPDDMEAMKDVELSNLHANQLIYKQLSAANDGSEVSTNTGNVSGYVVVENAGLIGSFNRANRSMHHFVENAPATGVRIMCCAYLFPVPTFATTVFLCIGRVLHQVGYADPTGFFSTVRLVGYVVFFMLLGETPQTGFVLFGGLKALGAF